jgi:hypothetical protein
MMRTDKVWIHVAGTFAILGAGAIIWAEHIIRVEARAHQFDRLAALRVVWPQYIGLGILGLALILIIPIPFLALAAKARRSRMGKHKDIEQPGGRISPVGAPDVPKNESSP